MSSPTDVNFWLKKIHSCKTLNDLFTLLRGFAAKPWTLKEQNMMNSCYVNIAKRFIEQEHANKNQTLEELFSLCYADTAPHTETSEVTSPCLPNNSSFTFLEWLDAVRNTTTKESMFNTLEQFKSKDCWTDTQMSTMSRAYQAHLLHLKDSTAASDKPIATTTTTSSSSFSHISASLPKLAHPNPASAFFLPPA